MSSNKSAARKARFLVFSRNYILGDFQASFRPVSDKFDFFYITDGVSAIGPDTRKIFYGALKKEQRSAELNEDEIEDVIARCRFLRNIDHQQAKNLVHAMTIALTHYIDSFRPDALISQMVDEYTTHVFALLAKKRELGYLGYCAGYFPGTSLLLADPHGRPYRWRAVDEAEISERLDCVSGMAFRQTYNLGASYNLAKHLKSMVRYRVKVAYFALRGWIEKDPFHLHYRQTPFIAERRWLKDYPASSMFSIDWQSDLNALRKHRPSANVIYMPLSYFPESTIDYWVLDKRMIAYAPMIQKIVEILSRENIVVVKEHLHMMGARDAALLRALNRIDGVVSVPPLELSNKVVAQADTVLLGSGSPGIEATIRGKPVVTFCNTSYWFEPSGSTYLDLSDIEAWAERINEVLENHVPMTPDMERQFVSECLEASTRVRAEQSIWPLLAAEDLIPLLTGLAETKAGDRIDG